MAIELDPKWKEIDISKKDALEKLQTFVGGRWNDVTEDDIEITVQTNGIINRLYIIEDKRPDTENKDSKILCRLIGGKTQDVKYLPLESIQAIVYFAMSQTKLGPHLYGVFNGGRIEEYIPSRVVSFDQLVNSNEIRKHIARKLARIHSMKDIPMKRAINNPFERTIGHFESFETEEGKNDFDKFCKFHEVSLRVDFDWRAEYEWLSSVYKQVTSPIVFTIGDGNVLNCLVREEPDSFGEIVTLIDYEFSRYDHRGCDIGGHFNNWRWDLTQPLFRSNCSYPNEAIRREFCQEYLMLTRELADCELDPEMDTVEHLMKEAHFFSLLFNFQCISQPMGLREADSILWNPIFGKGISTMANDSRSFYESLKKEFQATYNL